MPDQGAAPNVITAAIPNFEHLTMVSLALSPAACGAATATEQTFTVTGLSMGDSLQARDVILNVYKPTAQTGLSIGSCRVSAANTISIQFINPTAGSITPTAAEIYTITVWRPCQLAQANATVV